MSYKGFGGGGVPLFWKDGKGRELFKTTVLKVWVIDLDFIYKPKQHGRPNMA